MNYFEVAFDILYLVSVISLSIIIFTRGIKKHHKATMLFGIMGFLLGFGDSFHLIPRIIAHLTTGLEDYQMALGIGKLITGITMTIFYYLIYRYYVLLTEKDSQTIHTTIITLMIIRFILLALPGNDWINNGNSLFYGILRNIPFAILGSLIVVLFLKIGKEKEYRLFKKMGVWIIVSFVCYTIVVVGSGFIPVLGAFMIPKTIAYFIIIYIGFKN
ncbi:MAG: hypothetical protein KQ78_01053 [Candidatus Izimaplasma bacterium HR2]|nr:MAG: hypothetical protein KQ78_01053 [Candidatus Izimaplasma bacterium HR2]